MTGGPGSPLLAGPASPAAGRMDLLTVVLHEMGHLAGLPDSNSAGLMDEVLATGTRETQALDQVFASGAFGNQPAAGPSSGHSLAGANRTGAFNLALAQPLLQTSAGAASANTVSSGAPHTPGGGCNCPLCQALRSGALVLHQVNPASIQPTPGTSAGAGKGPAVTTPPL